MLAQLVRNSRRALDEGAYEKRHGLAGARAMAKALASPSIISEIKFASPSAGRIASGDPGRTAALMAGAGARAVSVLTQPYLFGGSVENLAAARRAVGVPLLMKDIVVEKEQIDAGASAGADCVLLIQAVFDAGHAGNMEELLEHGHKRGLDVLLEVHTEKEMERAARAGADIIGINSRSLDTLRIDDGLFCRLARGFSGGPLVAESGVRTAQDVRRLRACGADALLVGTSVMSGDVGARVSELVGAL